VTTKIKDPDEVVDYLTNLGPEMAKTSDTIASITSVTISPTGLVLGTGGTAPAITAGTDRSGLSVTSGAVRWWVSGGTLGVTYAVTCRVVTAGARTLDRTAFILIDSR
jgi:hypothetical protein